MFAHLPCLASLKGRSAFWLVSLYPQHSSETLALSGWLHKYLLTNGLPWGLGLCLFALLAVVASDSSPASGIEKVPVKCLWDKIEMNEGETAREFSRQESHRTKYLEACLMTASESCQEAKWPGWQVGVLPSRSAQASTWVYLIKYEMPEVHVLQLKIQNWSQVELHRMMTFMNMY